MSKITLLDGDVTELTQMNIPFRNHSNFLFHLYHILDRACNKIAASSKKISKLKNIETIVEIRNRLQDDDRKALTKFIEDTLEDDLSIRIVDIVSENPRFNAVHDGYHNGHVDLFIQSFDLMHTWLGEAKLYSGLKYSEQGLQQLVESYSKGSKNESGGILIYVVDTQLAISTIIEDWKNHLLEISKDLSKSKVGMVQPLSDLEIHSEEDCSEILISLHTHHLSGSKDKYKIRHFCLDVRDNR